MRLSLGPAPFSFPLSIRPGVLVFALAVLVSFGLTAVKLIRWEKRLPAGEIDFQGVIADSEGLPPLSSQTIHMRKAISCQGIPVLVRVSHEARLGDLVEGQLVFRLGQGSRNPGAFSERGWLWARGAAWISTSGTVRVISRSDPVLWFRRLPEKIRDYVRRHHQILWQGRSGPLVLSLALGDTRLLDDRQTYLLRTAGLSHLTSVSGTHLLFLLGPFRRLTRRSPLSCRSKFFLSLPLTLLPGLLAGWKSGISRASLISLASSFDTPLRARRDFYNLLFLTASLMLALNPYALYETSFWMSFSAAAAVNYTAGRLGRPDKAKDQGLAWRFVRGLGLKTRSAFSFSLSAQLILLPYQMMSSPGLHLLSPLVNVAAIPLAALLTAAAYPLILVLCLLPASSKAMCLVSGAADLLFSPLSDAILALSEVAGRLPGAFLPLEWMLCGLLILAVIRWPGRVWKRFFAALCLMFLMIFWIFSPKAAQVFFLDVGQGDATLLVTPDRKTVLIDGGDLGQGYRTLAPALRMLGLSRIDLAIITHSHSDHVQGIAELMSLGMVRQLAMSGRQGESRAASGEEEDLTDWILAQAQARSVRVSQLKPGDLVKQGACSIEILHPQDNQGLTDLNDLSLVMRIFLEDFSLLLTGDLTEKGERVLLNREVSVKADLLHVGHHGSANATSTAFLDAAGPRVALISAGLGNRYGHPHEEVLHRLAERHITICRTDESGAVSLKIGKGKVRINKWLSGP